MSFSIPNNFHALYSEEDIRAGILEIAPKIESWILEQKTVTGKEPIALCVLRGAVYFFSDLTRAVNQSVSIEFIRYSTYDKNENSPLPDDKLPELNISLDLAGRSVLIIDDICESGRLLSILKKECLAIGASSVKTAVLVYRDIPRSMTTPDFYCFKIQYEDWLVGYGLDDKDRYRNLPGVYKIQQLDV